MHGLALTLDPPFEAVMLGQIEDVKIDVHMCREDCGGTEIEWPMGHGRMHGCADVSMRGVDDTTDVAGGTKLQLDVTHHD